MTQSGRLLAAFGALLAAACSQPSPCQGDAAVLLRAHLNRYPAMEVADGYKLLHQANMGSEHAVSDRGAAAQWMEREWAEMAEGPEEPLVDTLGAAARFARVHLRSWRAAGGSPDVLVDAFVQTANGTSPDTGALSCALDQMAGLAGQGGSRWDAATVKSFIGKQRSAGYPAAHHSAAYEASVRPAYRLVGLPLVPGLLATLPGGR